MYFSSEQRITLHQLATKLEIKHSEVLAIIAILESSGDVTIRLLIYHQCKPSCVAEAIPYGNGFPNLPWKCPICETEVSSYDELNFEFMVITASSFFV